MKAINKIFAIAIMLALVAIPSMTSIAQEDDDTTESTFIYNGRWGYFLPDGWVSQTLSDEDTLLGIPDELYLATSQETLDAFQNEDYPVITSGNIAMAHTIFEYSVFEQFINSETNSVQYNLLDFLTQEYQASDVEIEFVSLDSEPIIEEFFIGERAVAISVIKTVGFDGYLTASQISPSNYLISIIAFAEGESADMQQTAVDVYDGIYFSEPLHSTFEDETLSFSYPEYWIIQAGQPYLIANNEAALEKTDEQFLAPDDYLITVYDMTEDDLDTPLDQYAFLLATQLFETSENLTVEIVVFGGQSVISVRYIREEGYEYEGGLVMTQYEDGSRFAVVYLTGYDQTSEIVLTAANILLSIESIE